jgi:predicted CopG family antitoxin
MSETIEIDQDAFEQLQKARGSQESVSEVIKRCVRPVRSVEEVLDVLRNANVADETLQTIDDSVMRRRRAPRRRRA